MELGSNSGRSFPNQREAEDIEKNVFSFKVRPYLRTNNYKTQHDIIFTEVYMTASRKLRDKLTYQAKIMGEAKIRK